MSDFNRRPGQRLILDKEEEEEWWEGPVFFGIVILFLLAPIYLINMIVAEAAIWHTIPPFLFFGGMCLGSVVLESTSDQLFFGQQTRTTKVSEFFDTVAMSMAAIGLPWWLIDMAIWKLT
jgi:hypothetical protein